MISRMSQRPPGRAATCLYQLNDGRYIFAAVQALQNVFINNNLPQKIDCTCGRVITIVWCFCLRLQAQFINHRLKYLHVLSTTAWRWQPDISLSLAYSSLTNVWRPAKWLWTLYWHTNTVWLHGKQFGIFRKTDILAACEATKHNSRLSVLCSF